MPHMIAPGHTGLPSSSWKGQSNCCISQSLPALRTPHRTIHWASSFTAPGSMMACSSCSHRSTKPSPDSCSARWTSPKSTASSCGCSSRARPCRQQEEQHDGLPRCRRCHGKPSACKTVPGVDCYQALLAYSGARWVADAQDAPQLQLATNCRRGMPIVLKMLYRMLSPSSCPAAVTWHQHCWHCNKHCHTTAGRCAEA